MGEDVRSVLVRQSVAIPAQRVWGAMLDLGALVCQGSNVRSVDMLPGIAPDRRVVDWKIWLKGFELLWQEEQTLDAPKKRIEFRQTQGMFSTYHGSWQVSDTGDGALVELHIHVDTGLPYLSRFVNPVIANAFEVFAHELVAVWTCKSAVA